MMAGYTRSFAAAAIAGAVALVPIAVYAASESESECSAGMPQFNYCTFPSQLFWLAVILVVFFIAMRGSALPRVGGALEARRQKIDDDLDKAAAHREEAEAAMAAYERALAEAAAEAQAIHREAAQAVAAKSAERRATLTARLAEDTKSAEARIAAAKEPVIASLHDVAAEVVQDATAKLAGIKVTGADARAAVEAALQEAG